MSEDILSELFARDPLKLSDIDIDLFIAAYIKERKNFATGGGKKEGKKTAVKSNPSLADLGLL